MKTRDRNLLILVIILVSCFAALFILLSNKDSKQNILSPVVLPIRGFFGGNRGSNSNTTVVVGGGSSSSSSSSRSSSSGSGGSSGSGSGPTPPTPPPPAGP